MAPTTSFRDALRDFLRQTETGDRFNPARWEPEMPFTSELSSIEGPLLRSHVRAAARADCTKGAIWALVWGYPKGFVDAKQPQLLKQAIGNIGALVAAVEELKAQSAKLDADAVVRKLNKTTKGLATASTTKVAYFAGLMTKQGPTLIFDQQVIRGILLSRAPELEPLRTAMAIEGKPRDFKETVTFISQRPESYKAYLSGLLTLSLTLGGRFKPEDLERYLFAQGRGREEARRKRKTPAT